MPATEASEIRELGPIEVYRWQNPKGLVPGREHIQTRILHYV